MDPNEKTVRTCCRCEEKFYPAAGRPNTCFLCKSKTIPGEPRVGQHLTPREVQVVALVVTGIPNKEVAYLLHLSEWTVKSYLTCIFIKTGVGNRTTLAFKWQAGLLKPLLSHGANRNLTNKEG